MKKSPIRKMKIQIGGAKEYYDVPLPLATEEDIRKSQSTIVPSFAGDKIYQAHLLPNGDIVMRPYEGDMLAPSLFRSEFIGVPYQKGELIFHEIKFRKKGRQF